MQRIKTALIYIYIYIYNKRWKSHLKINLKSKLHTGQAGTIFYDSRLTDEMATGKVVRKSLDRLSIIIMGGVAAEANKYGKTEGGLDDERQLIDFFQTQLLKHQIIIHQ